MYDPTRMTTAQRIAAISKLQAALLASNVALANAVEMLQAQGITSGDVVEDALVALDAMKEVAAHARKVAR